MRRRLTTSILGVAVLAVVLFGIPLAIVVQRFVDERAALRLERQAVLASRQVPADFATNGDPVELPTTEGITYGLYDRRGRRIAGSGPIRPDAAVVSALTNAVGQGEQGETRVAAIPIVDHERVTGVLRASQSTSVADRQAQRAILLLGLLGVGVIAVGALLARLVAGRLARPVRQLRDQAVRLGDGDFGIKTNPTGVPELDDASSALVATANRLADLVRRERAFSADASHQLRTPLAALRTNLETELRFPRASNRLVLTEALEDISRLEATIAQLLEFARTASVSRATIDVGAMLERLKADWNGRLADQGRPLVVSWPGQRLTASGTEPLVRQALDALIDNAAKHGEGEVRVAARYTDESVTLAISDNGPGFPALTDDAYRALQDGAHGYGLPLARRLVESGQGRLVIVRRAPKPILEIVLVRQPDAARGGQPPAATST